MRLRVRMSAKRWGKEWAELSLGSDDIIELAASPMFSELALTLPSLYEASVPVIL